MKRLTNIIGWLLLTGLVVASLVFTNIAQNKQQCRSFSVEIDYGREGGDYLLTAEEVKEHVFGAAGSPVGMALTGISLQLYEYTVSQIPYVASADVYMTIDGHMNARIVQRQPIMRVQDVSNNAYYLDGEGVKMPVSIRHSAHVLFAGGYIADSISAKNHIPLTQADEDLKDTRLYKAWTVAKHINSDEFLNALISQIYIEKNGEIQMVPRIGEQLIILGGTDELREKFDKLKHFYRLGMTRTGWDKYKTINLKFKDQVVCTKK